MRRGKEGERNVVVWVGTAQPLRELASRCNVVRTRPSPLHISQYIALDALVSLAMYTMPGPRSGGLATRNFPRVPRSRG